MEVGRTWVLCVGLCVLSHDLCGQLGNVSGWLRSASSFWKHFAHMCFTLTSLPHMFFVWGADWSHEPDWKSLHHHTIFLSSPQADVRALDGLSPPVFFPLVLGCLRPNLDDQSTFPGFSITIFSTCSKFESQVAKLISILAKIAACKCSNFDHSTYCALYAIVFNICSLRCASFRFILPPMITSISPATNNPNDSFLNSMFSPFHPHKYSCCNAACGYSCLFTTVSIFLSFIPECILSPLHLSQWLPLSDIGGDVFHLPCLLSLLASENAPLDPLLELSGPPSVDVPGDGEADLAAPGKPYRQLFHPRPWIRSGCCCVRWTALTLRSLAEILGRARRHTRSLPMVTCLRCSRKF